jgi:thiol-disulfide isomerase/thioredoxin
VLLVDTVNALTRHANALRRFLTQKVDSRRDLHPYVKSGTDGAQHHMNLGSYAVPVGPVLFFVSIAVAIFSGWLVDRKSRDIEPAILKSVLIGLLVARATFVMQYLPAYGGDFLKMLDIRDTGFSPVPGVIAGIAVIIWSMARRRNIRRPLLAGAVAGFVTWFLASEASSYWQPSAMVPNISLTNASGTLQPIKFHDGKPLVVNLWATWCAPCQDEMPALADIQKTNSKIDLVFVNQGETSGTIDAFLRRLNLHIVNALLDPGLDVARATGVSAYPTTLFYDASGRLLDKHVGRFSRATFSAALDRLYPSAGAHPTQ